MRTVHALQGGHWLDGEDPPEAGEGRRRQERDSHAGGDQQVDTTIPFALFNEYGSAVYNCV